MAETIKHKRGDTLAWDVTWWADDAKSTRLDLTGWTVTARAKHTSGDAQDMIVNITDATQGIVSVELDAAATATMEPGVWSVDIQRVDAAGVTVSTDTFWLKIIEDIA